MVLLKAQAVGRRCRMIVAQANLGARLADVRITCRGVFIRFIHAHRQGQLSRWRGVALVLPNVNLTTQCSLFAQETANISTTNGIMVAAFERNQQRYLESTPEQNAALETFTRRASRVDSGLYGFHAQSHGRVARHELCIFKYSLTVRIQPRLPNLRGFCCYVGEFYTA